MSAPQWGGSAPGPSSIDEMAEVTSKAPDATDNPDKDPDPDVDPDKGDKGDEAGEVRGRTGRGAGAGAVLASFRVRGLFTGKAV
jgi:hypothetical protein